MWLLCNSVSPPARFQEVVLSGVPAVSSVALFCLWTVSYEKGPCRSAPSSLTKPEGEHLVSGEVGALCAASTEAAAQFCFLYSHNQGRWCPEWHSTSQFRRGEKKFDTGMATTMSRVDSLGAFLSFLGPICLLLFTNQTALG